MLHADNRLSYQNQPYIQYLVPRSNNRKTPQYTVHQKYHIHIIQNPLGLRSSSFGPMTVTNPAKEDKSVGGRDPVTTTSSISHLLQRTLRQNFAFLV